MKTKVHRKLFLIASSHSHCRLSLLLRHMLTQWLTKCEFGFSWIKTQWHMHRRQVNEPRETMVSASVRWNTRNWMLVRELVCTCWPAFLWAVISTSRLRLPPTTKWVRVKINKKKYLKLRLSDEIGTWDWALYNRDRRTDGLTLLELLTEPLLGPFT